MNRVFLIYFCVLKILSSKCTIYLTIFVDIYLIYCTARNHKDCSPFPPLFPIYSYTKIIHNFKCIWPQKFDQLTKGTEYTGYFELSLCRTNFHLPCECEITGLDCTVILKCIWVNPNFVISSLWVTNPAHHGSEVNFSIWKPVLSRERFYCHTIKIKRTCSYITSSFYKRKEIYR